MDTFAFIIHPIDPKRDVQRKYPLLGRIASERLINLLCPLYPPVYISEINGIVSEYNKKEIKGWLIACPLTPSRILELPERIVYRKIIETGRLAIQLGAKILGLGAFTSVVGDSGVSIAQALEIPVTTGDSYTVAIAVQALQKAAELVGIPCAATTAAVIGATGAIGQACAELLASSVAELYLIGRRQKDLEELSERIQTNQPRPARLKVSTNLDPLREAQMILTATSSLHAIVQPEHLRPGTVVCDLARPRDISARVAATRPDVLVIDGGLVDIPGPVDFHFDFGLPRGMAYACMAETMALALEGRFEDYTLGKQISLSRVQEIAAIAAKHGFRLSEFRSFDRPVTAEQIWLIQDKMKAYSRS